MQLCTIIQSREYNQSIGEDYDDWMSERVVTATPTESIQFVVE